MKPSVAQKSYYLNEGACTNVIIFSKTSFLAQDIYFARLPIRALFFSQVCLCADSLFLFFSFLLSFFSLFYILPFPFFISILISPCNTNTFYPPLSPIGKKTQRPSFYKCCYFNKINSSSSNFYTFLVIFSSSSGKTIKTT